MGSKAGVYLIYCHKTRMAYVGSSKNVARRLTSHRHNLRHGIHGNSHLQNAWDRYGEQAFSMGLLESCVEGEQLQHEQVWLDIWLGAGASYNRHPKAESPLGVKWTDEEKQKASQRVKANPPFLGRTHSEQSRKLISAHASKRLGERNPFFGKSHTDATKAALSLANKGNSYCVGRKFSEETRAEMSRTRKGRKHTEESRRKISAVTTGAGNPNFGKVMSEESKAKARATRAANFAAGLHKTKPKSKNPA